MRRGNMIGSANPFLNTPPTKLMRDLDNERDEGTRRQMQEALTAWRTTVPGPFRHKSSVDPKKVLLAYYSRRVATDSEHRDCYNIIARLKPGVIKDIATKAKVKMFDLISLFKNPKVVKLFKALKWSFKNLYSLLKDGFKALKDLQKALVEYAKQSGIGKWTARQLDSQRLRDIDNWLAKHPKTKRIGGMVVAGMLVYIWFNMSFIGNPAFDFNMGDMLGALSGSFSLSDIFSGAQGAALLVLFLTGLAGFSFPWPGPASIQFISAILGTIAHKIGKRLRKAAHVADYYINKINIADRYPDNKTEIQARIRLRVDDSEYNSQQQIMDRIRKIESVLNADIILGEVGSDGVGIS